MFRSLAVGFFDLLKVTIFMRVLGQHEYGLMALAVIVPGMLRSFTATGIEVMIQRDDPDFEERLPCYWTISCIKGVLLMCGCWFAASPLARFYGNSDLLPLVRLLSVSFLFEGLGGFGKQIRERRMDFRSVALMDSASAAVVLLGGVCILLVTRSFWALAFYVVLNSVATMICSWLLYPWRPGFRFDAGVFRSVAVFAGSMIVLDVCGYFHASFDRAVLARLFTIDDAGYYSRGHFLAMLIVQYVATAISPVFLSAFRTIGSDPRRLRSAFIKSILAFALIFIPLGLALFIGAKLVVLVVCGSQWLRIVPVFRILLLYGVSRSIALVTCPVFYLKGKPWLVSISSGVMAALLAVLCVPLTRRYGMIGTAVSVVVSGCTSHILAILLAFRHLRCERSEPCAGRK